MLPDSTLTTDSQNVACMFQSYFQGYFISAISTWRCLQIYICT